MRQKHGDHNSIKAMSDTYPEGNQKWCRKMAVHKHASRLPLVEKFYISRFKMADAAPPLVLSQPTDIFIGVNISEQNRK